MPRNFEVQRIAMLHIDPFRSISDRDRVALFGCWLVFVFLDTALRWLLLVGMVISDLVEINL